MAWDEVGNAYKHVVKKLVRKRALEIPRRISEVNIKKGFKEVGCGLGSSRSV
jgi:hypothetical protein